MGVADVVNSKVTRDSVYRRMRIRTWRVLNRALGTYVVMETAWEASCRPKFGVHLGI